LSVYLLARRMKVNQVAFLASDFSIGMLWLFAITKGDLAIIPFCVTCFIYVFYDVYGLFEWTKLERRQKTNKQTISTIDLWNVFNDEKEILIPALFDEFDKYGHNLYDEIQVIRNCRIDYLSKESYPSRSNIVLFLRGKKPLRLVLLGQCDFEKVIETCFKEKCLPNKLSVNELCCKYEIKIIYKDMKQTIGNEYKLEIENGSCDRKELLETMLGGSYTADGGDTIDLKSLNFDPNRKVNVVGETDEFLINIPHKGRLTLEFENGIKRYIFLQDNGELTREYVEGILEKT